MIFVKFSLERPEVIKNFKNNNQGKFPTLCYGNTFGTNEQDQVINIIGSN